MDPIAIIFVVIGVILLVAFIFCAWMARPPMWPTDDEIKKGKK